MNKKFHLILFSFSVIPHNDEQVRFFNNRYLA